MVMEQSSKASDCAFPPPTCVKTGKIKKKKKKRQQKNPHSIVTLWDGVGVGTILIGRSHLKGAGPTLHVEGDPLGLHPLREDGSELCAEKLPGVIMLEFQASQGSGNG